MLNPPPSKHRLSIPLTQETFEVYSELAKLLNRSTGATIAEWLTDSLESAKQMTYAIRQIRGNPERAMRNVALLAESAELVAQTALRRVSGDLFEGAPGAGGTFTGRLPGAPKPDLTPPSSNTGGKVGISKNPGRAQK